MKQVFVLFILLSMLGCKSSVKGDGNVVEVTREVQNFQDLALAGSIDVQITPGDTYAIKVITDENILPYVITEVKKNELQVHYQNGISIINAHTKVVVTVPFLNIIKSSGSGYIVSDGTISNNQMVTVHSGGSGKIDLSVNTPAVKISGAGSGIFILQGETKDLDGTLAGSGDIDTRDLKAENVKVRIAGSGSAKVFASNSLKVSIAGSGNLLYWGNPSLDEVNVAGSGKVRAGN